ncbi:MAG: RNA polymerase sigma factor [Clostridia bacterium]|nr:RNA polymerase sigma factor [Clostridia bacterium]
MDDSKIVDLFLQRDEDAIKHTSEKYGSRLRSLAYGIVRDERTAEECENDTYLEAWNSIPPHEPRDYLYAFLARITRHLTLNRCRDSSRLKRKAYISDLGEELDLCIPSREDVENRMDNAALGKAINGFLGTLDAEKRNILIRRYWYLDSVSDISKRFSMSESKVKTTLFRCRNRLREYLEKEGYVV